MRLGDVGAVGLVGLVGLVLTAAFAVAAAQPPPGEAGTGGRVDRAEATRQFLGLGAEPDRAAAARGAPVFAANCAFCHGPQARGAEGPSLIVSDVVLSDDHGEKLAPFLQKGRPEKGMPSFAHVPGDQLRDLAEFLHLQVEEVANRGTYKLPNIVVGDAGRGKAYFQARCATCHSLAGDLAHIGAKYRSPDELQRNWVWPSRRPGDSALAETATVVTPAGTVAGRLVQISDFRVTVVDPKGETHVIERSPKVEVTVNDPLAPHAAMLAQLSDDDMHDVTAYLDAQK